MTSAPDTSPKADPQKQEGGATPPSPTTAPARPIIQGLCAAGLVLALVIGLGSFGGGSDLATPTLEEIDPGMVAFERDLQDLLTRVETLAEPAASGAAQPSTTATPKE